VNNRENHSVAGTSSSWINLGVRFAVPAIWWGASWAALCGVVASGEFLWDMDLLLRLVVVLLLADPLFSQLCHLLFDRDWTLDTVAVECTSGAYVRLVPYTENGSPAQRLGEWLRNRVLWWKRALWPQLGTQLSGVLVAVCGVLLVGLTLARAPVLWLVITGLVTVTVGVLIRPYWAGGASVLRAVAEVGIPWLVGCLAFGSASPSALLAAGLYVVIYWTSLRLAMSEDRAAAWPISLALSGFLVIAIVLRQPVIAVLLALVSIFPAWLSWHGMGSSMASETFLRKIRYYLLGATLLSALAVGLA